MPDEMEGLKIIGEIQHVRLQPGDVIVVTCPGSISPQLAEMIQRQTQRVFDGHKCIVLDAGLRMEVARREQADA